MKCVKLKDRDPYGEAIISRAPNETANKWVENGRGKFTTKNAWRGYVKRLQKNIDRRRAATRNR